MASTGKMVRQYSKDQFARMREGNLVSDRETQQFSDNAREQAQAGLQAQQSTMNRAAAANKAGSPVVAGVIQDSAKKVAATTADAAVKASGQASQFSSALREQRKQATMANARTQMAQNREDLGMVLDSASALSAMGNELGLFP